MVVAGGLGPGGRACRALATSRPVCNAGRRGCRFLIVPRYAPVALVLALPVYEDPFGVLRATLLWLAVTTLMEGLEDRFVDETLPTSVRRMSARLLSVVVLYYTLLPVIFL